MWMIGCAASSGAEISGILINLLNRLLYYWKWCNYIYINVYVGIK